MYLFPKPQKLILKEEVFSTVIEKVSLGSFSYLILKELEKIFKKPLEKTETPSSGTISFIENKGVHKQGYLLSIKAEQIIIEASTDAGAYYGVQTLKQIYKQSPVHCLEIDDYPDLEIRGIMLDISRNKVPLVSTIKMLIDFFSSLKINHLQLYLEGFALEYKKYQNIIPHKNHITQSEYIEIENYANEHFIDLVPNQNGFGHMEEWLALDEFKHLAECPEGFTIWGSHRPPTTLNPLDEGSIELVKSLYDELLPISTSKYCNMNFDEPYELGHGKSKQACEELSKEDVYINYFNSLASHVRSYHKIPMLWGDVLVHNKEAIYKLPRDVIFIDWGYNKDYNFKDHAEMLNEVNVKYLLAPGTSTWSTITGRYDDMYMTIQNSAEAAKENNGLGILTTDWGDIGHLQYLPFSLPGFILGACCSWSKLNEEELKVGLSNALGNIELADVLLELSKYTNLEGEYRSYGSRLFSSILWAEHVIREKQGLDVYFGKIKSNLLEEEAIEKLSILFSSSRQKLDNLQDNLVCKEFINSIFILETLLELNIFFKKYLDNVYDETALQNVSKKLNDYAQSHYELWCERNLEEGYHISIQKINKVQRIIEMIQTKEKSV